MTIVYKGVKLESDAISLEELRMLVEEVDFPFMIEDFEQNLSNYEGDTTPFEVLSAYGRNHVLRIERNHTDVQFKIKHSDKINFPIPGSRFSCDVYINEQLDDRDSATNSYFSILFAVKDLSNYYELRMSVNNETKNSNSVQRYGMELIRTSNSTEEVLAQINTSENTAILNKWLTVEVVWNENSMDIFWKDSDGSNLLDLTISNENLKKTGSIGFGYLEESSYSFNDFYLIWDKLRLLEITQQ